MVWGGARHSPFTFPLPSILLATVPRGCPSKDRPLWWGVCVAARRPMYRLFAVSSVAHRYFWAHGLLSVIGFLALRTASLRHGITLSFMMAFLTCALKVWLSRLCPGKDASSPPAAAAAAAATAVMVTTTVPPQQTGERRRGALVAFARSLVWPVVEALATTSIVFNSISFHFQFLYLLVCVLSSSGLPAVIDGAERRHCDTERLRHRPSCSGTAGAVRRVCAWSGTAVLTSGCCLALWGLRNEAHHNQGTIAAALLAAIVHWRSESFAGAAPALARSQERDGRRFGVPRSPFACMVLPLTSVLLVDDFSFYIAGDRPSILGLAQVVVGCVSRAAAQLLLERAMTHSRLDSPHGRVTRRDQVFLLVLEYFICLLYGYYYLCEHMSVHTVPQAFLTLMFLGLYYVTLEMASNWMWRFVEREDPTGDEDSSVAGRESASEDTAAAVANERVRTEAGSLIPIIASLHSGFYSP